jgi:hypothetical protein
MQDVRATAILGGNTSRYLFIVFAAALIFRLVFVFGAPWVGGDGWKYLLVAENILRNFCVSVSEPALGECVPHWGGNQMPGYPFFVAMNWALFGETITPVLITQAVVAAAAVAWLARALRHLTGSPQLALFVGLILSVSPLQIAWPRQAMTETLAIALTTILLAELIISLDQKRLRLWPIIIILIISFFCRYDSVLLCFPIALTGFLIHPPLQAISKGIVIIVAVSLPVGAWLARNVASGLTALPVVYQTADGSEGPIGYIAWIKTWNTSLYDSMGATFPIASQRYSKIVIPGHAYRNDAERTRVTALLAELSKHDSGPFPSHINEEFRKIAATRRTEDKIRYWLVNPARRIAHQWLTPFAGFGWPTATEDSSEIRRLRALVQQGPLGMIEAIWSYPAAALAKGLVAGYRYLLLALSGFMVYAAFKWLPRNIRLIVLLGLSYAVVRTIMFSFFNESRYLVGAIPGMEMAVGSGLFILWHRRPTNGTVHRLRRQRRGAKGDPAVKEVVG